MASRSMLLQAARNASRASRAAAAAASRAAALAARSAREAARLSSALQSRDDASTKQPRDDDDDAPSFKYTEYYSSAEDEQVPDDAKTPTEKDLESDQATWALNERWCKAFGKERDLADMARRFKLFRYYVKDVHFWNTYLPPDPKEAAIYVRKRKKAKSLLSKDQDVSHFDECYLPMELGPFADGGDPILTECDERLLKGMEEMDPFSAVSRYIYGGG